MVPQPEEKREPVVVDYLKQMVSKRIKKGEKPDYYYKSKEIKKHIKHPEKLTPEVQYDEIKEFSRKLNEKADMKAQEEKNNEKSKVFDDL
jgi:DNA-binding transcriptional regulator GbsR (MarR family)